MATYREFHDKPIDATTAELVSNTFDLLAQGEKSGVPAAVTLSKIDVSRLPEQIQADFNLYTQGFLAPTGEVSEAVKDWEAYIS